MPRIQNKNREEAEMELIRLEQRNKLYFQPGKKGYVK